MQAHARVLELIVSLSMLILTIYPERLLALKNQTPTL